VTALSELLSNPQEIAMQEVPPPRDFVDAMAPALRQAASIARALEGRVAKGQKDGEATAIKAAVTVADTASQEALLVPLLEHFPHVRLEAEEDTPTVERFAESSEALVVVDPIDGTLRFYLERFGPYAVMIGMAIHGRYEAGLVALPREGIYLDAVRGGGARVTHEDGTTQIATISESTGKRVLISHDLPSPAVDVLRNRGYEVAPASGGALSVAPLIPGVCAALRVVRANPEGVSIRGRIGVLIAAEAGALVRGVAGEFPSQIREHAPALLVASTEEHIEALQDALAAIDPNYISW
jgi:fructose-1,6-bisphosphatase/inositol monophosphatase family enzyme